MRRRAVMRGDELLGRHHHRRRSRSSCRRRRGRTACRRGAWARRGRWSTARAGRWARRRCGRRRPVAGPAGRRGAAPRLLTRVVGAAHQRSRTRSRRLQPLAQQRLAAGVVGGDRARAISASARRSAFIVRPRASPRRLRQHVQRDVGEGGAVVLGLGRCGLGDGLAVVLQPPHQVGRRIGVDMPSSRDTTPSVISRAMSASKVCEPSASDFSIASLTP
jgi:hypothetical protein